MDVWIVNFLSNVQSTDKLFKQWTSNNTMLTQVQFVVLWISWNHQNCYDINKTPLRAKQYFDMFPMTQQRVAKPALILVYGMDE